MPPWLKAPVERIHWVHGVAFVLFGLWYWVRGGRRFPTWVHALALIALVAGVGVTLSLPPPNNPDPVVQWLFPIVLPTFFVVATYLVAAVMLGHFGSRAE